MRKHLLPGSVAALLAATGLASAQQQPAPADTASVQSDGFSLTTGADYSTGKYGGTSSTDILYVPLTGAYEMDKWLFKVTVPYIMVTGPGNVVRGIGIIKNKAAGRRTTQSGVGDAVAAVKLSEGSRLGAIFHASQAPSPVSGPERDVTAYLTQQLSERWKLQIYGDHGFANGSPDWGGGAMASFRF